VDSLRMVSEELARQKEAVERQTTTPLEEYGRQREIRYFGYNLFENIPTAFEPNPVGPVDDGYLVGPGDELRLSVWGAAEFQYDITVDREGRVFIPNVGQLTVAGRRLDALRRDMRNSLSRSYAGLTSDPPSVFMDLTLTRLRPVQVFVLGEVARPGGYTISSYSTAFNVLYSVGGPLTSGSLRSVRVVRNGRVLGDVDIYNYLLKGYDDNPIRLQSNDFIFIPPREITVSIEGDVYRPAIYELTEGEGMSELIDFAGGLLPDAYTKRFQIDRIIPFEERSDPSIARELLDFSLERVMRGEQKVTLQDGDRVKLFSIVDEIENAVAVGGEVYQPGRYEIGASVRTISDLVREADGITGTAYVNKADLVRMRDDSTEVLVSLDLSRALQGDPLHDVALMPRDSLYVYSAKSFESTRYVSIGGQILYPGTYVLRDSMSVYDLLFSGGGLLDPEFLKDVYLERADLFRKLPDGKTETIIPFSLREVLAGGGSGPMLLQPEDSLHVYPLAVEVLEDRWVWISGAVETPGQYRYNDNMTVEDLIIQAGGLTEGAFSDHVEVARALRESPSGEREVVMNRVRLNPEGKRGGVDFRLGTNGDPVSEARAYRLDHRDHVFVRVDPNFRPLETVTIAGEVRFPGNYALAEENETLGQLIKRAGGVLPTGYAKGGRVTRDGRQLITQVDKIVDGDRRADVILQPGDDILIPKVPNAVSVLGNVVNEGFIKYESGRRLSYYLDRAGGLKDDTEAIVLTQASGATFRVRRGLIPGNPVVDDGAVIRVMKKPPQEEGDRVDVGQVITEGLAIVSSALTIIVLAIKGLN
ncbi:MAG: SLBB domain-containing protein, partial [Rhodothermales bacterium]|nr:SLBB domain-containing protein [Rhodothermales bacterium]